MMDVFSVSGVCGVCKRGSSRSRRPTSHNQQETNGGHHTRRGSKHIQVINDNNCDDDGDVDNVVANTRNKDDAMDGIAHVDVQIIFRFEVDEDI